MSAGKLLCKIGSEKTRFSKRCLLCSSQVTWNFWRCSFSWGRAKKKGNKIKVKNAMNMSNVLSYVGEQHSDEPGWAGSCWWFVQLDRGRCIPPAKVRWTGGLEEDLGLQLWSQVVPCSWNLQKGASIDALSFPRRIPEPAAPTAGRADRDPFHRVCGRKTINIMWEKKKKNSPSIDATSTQSSSFSCNTVCTV